MITNVIFNGCILELYDGATLIKIMKLNTLTYSINEVGSFILNDGNTQSTITSCYLGLATFKTDIDTALNTCLSQGITPPGVETLSSVVTDTTSGEITPVVKKINLDTNAIVYLNTDGTLLNGTGVLSGTQVDKAEPVLMVTGSEILSDITTTVTSLTAIPANSGVAYGEVKDGDCIYTVDGTTPDITAGAEVGKRVPNGGRITLRGIDEITKFKVLSYDVVTAVDIDFEFKNAE